MKWSVNQMSKSETRGDQPRLREGDVTFKMEVVDLIVDVFHCSPEGEGTVGNRIDEIIASVISQRKRFGKLTLDLSGLNYDDEEE